MFLLSGLFPVWERVSFFPGLLPRNTEECRQIEKHVLKPLAPDRESVVFHEMTDLELEPEEQDAHTGEQWSKDEWYCLDCIKELSRQRFLPWWKKTKQGGECLLVHRATCGVLNHFIAADGSTTQEDCW